MRDETIAIHAGYIPDSTRAVAVPIYQTVAHDFVSAEPADQLLVGQGRIGDDNEPICLGQLHGIAAEGTGRARDRNRPSLRYPEIVKSEPSGQGVHQNGRRAEGVDPCGSADDRGHRNNDEIVIRPAARPIWEDNRHHGITDVQ